MKRKYRYQIKISFEKSRTECGVGTFPSPYIGSKGNVDSITFFKGLLCIDFERSRLYSQEEILSNNRNSVYEQVQKCLLAYYAIASTFPKITKCTLIIYQRDEVLYDFTKTLNQPIQQMTKNKLTISPVNSVRILQNDSKGFALRSAISYWLTGMCSSDIYQKFDKLWRAFDRILLYEGDTTKEKDGINSIKNFIVTNSNKFTESTNYALRFPIDISTLSWGKLLMDKPSDICRKLMLYTDYRIAAVFSKICNDRNVKAELIAQSNLHTVLNHFSSNSSTTKDIDLVLLLSLTYTYYIRCKMFHAEFPDSSFKLIPTNEDKIIEALSNLLEIVVKELLENQIFLR